MTAGLYRQVKYKSNVEYLGCILKLFQAGGNFFVLIKQTAVVTDSH
jgi:hypothetical protein